MGTVTTTNLFPSVVVLEICRNFGEQTLLTVAKNEEFSQPSSCSKFCCICGFNVSHKMDPTMTPAQFGTFVRDILIPSCSSLFPSSSQFTEYLEESKWICRICLGSLEQVEFLREEMTKLEKALKLIVDLLRLKMAKLSSARDSVEVVDVDNHNGTGSVLPEDEGGKPIIVDKMDESDDLDINENVETLGSISPPDDDDVEINQQLNSEQGLFNCDICQREFTTRHGLGLHKLSRHHAPRKTVPLPKLPCDICKAYFCDKRTLSQHKLRFHDKVYPFFCKECGWKFMTSTYLKHHVAKHHGVGLPPRKQTRKEIHYCDTCNIGYSFKKTLLAHIKRVHSTDKVPKCDSPRCKQTFYFQSSQPAYKRHMDIVCNPGEDAKERNSRRWTELNVKYRKKVKMTSIKCSICGAGFLGQRKLDFHIARFHKGGGSILSEEEIKKEEDLDTGADEAEEDVKPIIVEEFEDLDINEDVEQDLQQPEMDAFDQLVQEDETCNNPSSPEEPLPSPTPTPLVDNEIINDQDVNADVDVNLNICGICKEKFANLRAKINHMRRAHARALADNGKMSCSLCDVVEFTSKYNFMIHMKRHKERGEWPYICSNCGRRSASHSDHRMHMDTVCKSDKKEKKSNRRLEGRTELMTKYRAKAKKKSK